ncbi:hypothetical protein U879_08435 [Defluviimonas sp. 20V17]|uniref:fimbria/pilus outer membrane usher protein n=1 Tax=Allgaiera indica TaxID=765699 RepID=UPI000459693C|nr:fimbria/pilus outer membrane usher protein [Allgaiera indica]KDB04125.1 hypothetical protein U879_08435 [Defluviimonas sp. 20V17]
MGHFALVGALLTGLFASTSTADGQIRKPVLNVADVVRPGAEMPLYLAVSINGRATGQIAHFFLHTASNRLSASRRTLRSLGLRLPLLLEGEVYLDQLPGIRAHYDADAQSLALTATDKALAPVVISAAPHYALPTPDRSVGAVLNYSLSAGFSWGKTIGNPGLTDVTGALNGWVYSPVGTLRSSGYIQSGALHPNGGHFTRLDTAYQFDLPKPAVSVTVGDFFTTALSWGRSIRMGGIQIRRDFALNENLLPQQLFAFSGAAAVPSTVDVFIANNRAFSTQVAPGPFELEDIAFPSGTGSAVIQVHGANRKVTSHRVSFFAARDLIKRGLLDFAFEAGHPREGYGIESNVYAGKLAYSTTLRYGLTDRITLQGHLEGEPGLHMFGLGLTATPFNLAETTFVMGASRYQGRTSSFAYGTLRTIVHGATVNMSILHSQNGFADLAYATGVDYLGTAAVAGSQSLLEFPRSQELIGVTFPAGREQRNVGVSLIHARRANSDDLIVAASYSRSLGWHDSSLDFYGSRDLNTRHSTLSLRVSIPLGDRSYSSVGVQQQDGAAIGPTAYVMRPISERVGDYGYSAQVERWAGGTQVIGGARYRSRYGKLGVDFSHFGGNSYLRPSLDGSIVLAGGRLAAGNTIHDSFALVDVGVAGVPIALQNRVVTQTGRFGMALVTGLTSNHPNRLSFNVKNLPEGATASATASTVVPASHSGMFVDLKADTRPSALVNLHDRTGQVLPLGAAVSLNGNSTPFSVGYDGETWLVGLKTQNSLRVTWPGGTCSASFAYHTRTTFQSDIDNIECH